jgi:hypothetical protein
MPRALHNSNAISKAANAWREKDLVHLHALIAAVDQAETTVNKFLESCPASSADGFGSPPLHLLFVTMRVSCACVSCEYRAMSSRVRVSVEQT